ncbi:hypothetical protein BHE74_00006242 [Ensete ventricosum]|uniref:Uncharacterized protein n=1 Tax=Ensete ventricosum TaxID=4639 RepID=A0A426YU92_ENSVE|nr:hypothetical protein B296_00029226 [Ensete ventricosum]RWW29014.1 hypothetical protein GW17_00006480 [Ensete ventricosum]RWW85112.1 hypothetical protein BHE74_00006242 [Ensete ventricosum]RZR88378.1 hypothetical protein BHM03_00015982 [Ensete ventricosum]
MEEEELRDRLSWGRVRWCMEQCETELGDGINLLVPPVNQPQRHLCVGWLHRHMMACRSIVVIFRHAYCWLICSRMASWLHDKAGL